MTLAAVSIKNGITGNELHGGRIGDVFRRLRSLRQATPKRGAYASHWVPIGILDHNRPPCSPQFRDHAGCGITPVE